MRVVKMEYNPYKMKTSICIDGSDVKGNSNYRSIDDFIGRGTPLQTWVEPIDYLNWPGLLNEIADPENNGEIEFCFSGRKIDFEDLKRSLEDQNKNREEGTRLSLRFRQEDPQLDDKKLSGNIEDIVKELQSDRFRELIEERSRSQDLKKKYKALETNYAKAKEREFDVVFAGVYSSGKSTLLNTLIRHNILPTSDSTCTSKNCRIKHDGSLGNKVSLLGLDEDQKVVLPKSVFDSDEACASKFMEVCPTGKVNPEYEKVTAIEIGADLSHLYPESVSEKNFTLVLVDTPGMDSAQSIDEDGVNQHAQLARQAITQDNSKPMVVLCVDAQKYEDKSIGEFMGDIIQQSVDERGGFNDRFLFLMNKCDNLTFGDDESFEDRKAAFAQYLRDSGKWGIASGEDEKRIQEAAHFVPRIFPVTAIVASAIQRGAGKYSVEERRNEPLKRTLYHELEKFQDNIDCADGNFYLSRFCDNPAYRRNEMDTVFQKALEVGDKITATQLQCGLMSVECAIRDYIARYAYPIKVRDLLETFEDILTDVCAFKDSTVADIQRRIDKLGENDGARKEAEERKRLAAERSAKLEEAKKLIDAQLDKLDEIKFDATALGKAREQFEASINADPIIHELRHKQKISTGKKSADDVKQEIKQKSAHIQSVFTQAGKGTLSTLETLKRDYDQKLEEIFAVVTNIARELESADVFSMGGYDFRKNSNWLQFSSLASSPDFEVQMKKGTVDRVDGYWDKRINGKKLNYQYSTGVFGLFKRAVSHFMPDYKKVWIDEKDGYYSTEGIRQELAKHLKNFEKDCALTAEAFEDMMSKNKATVEREIHRMSTGLSDFAAEIEQQQEKYDALSGDRVKLEIEKEKLSRQCDWLKKLVNKMEDI